MSLARPHSRPVHPCAMGWRLALALLLTALPALASVAAEGAAPANPAITAGQRIFGVHHSFHEGGFYNIPIGLTAPKELGPDGTALNALLQELAWDAVVHHRLSGVTAAP